MSRYRRELTISAVAILIGIILIQLLYPISKLLPFASVDGLEMSGVSKADATTRLNNQYADQPITIQFGSQTDSRRVSLKPADIGLRTNNAERVDNLSYPWYARLIPSSLLWYGMTQDADGPSYERDDEQRASFMKVTLGDSCNLKPVNATLEANNDSLNVVPSKNGGTCKNSDVETALRTAEPRLAQSTKLTIPTTVIPAKITDSVALKLANTLNSRLKGDVQVKVGDKTVSFKAATVASWLVFTPEKSDITVSISGKKANSELQKNLSSIVALKPGVTKVTTKDFVEVSRQAGSSGQALDVGATSDNVVEYLLAKKQTVTASVKPVAPSVAYVRTYSSTDIGLSALFKQYADDNDGTYGAQLIELSGERRRASYNADKQFITASTYKLFVAYSTLKRVEAGTWNWSDNINGGRDLSACFEDMIVRSDNDCAAALLDKIGFQAITNDAHELGCNHTTFLEKKGILSTPGDLALFLAELKSGQMLGKQSSRDRLLDAMKRNIYRQGIPAGINATVADKVGFLDDLLHDAAVVYSPKGAYVLVIMTEDSSWANIADLAKKVEKLR